ncbi:nucleoid-structuring protein H-NS [Pseudomonas vancouverensis]|uniref:Nucleoid-structuring protein H-NS n=1 Tax=Pseudomonas vancouverensis TaxID=95300 RepID=A0A4R4JQG9_PSEVA|nr:nucleoid-structuring protein H-NS [Pseudomonas vancouverensis]TDB56688.1 nucleoid-structuring protein H-NS [Pseudomonas vancouverensis]
MPRLGSACPRSGPAPWARHHRPSMAGGGYRGIPAAVPTAQNLHSASRGGVYRNSQSEAAYRPA